MTRKPLRWILGSVALLLVTWRAEAAEPAIVAKARAYLGTEQKLQAVTSVHYKGTIQAQDDVKMAVEIIAQKPFQQWMSISGPKVLEITALDEYEAWRRVQDVKDPSGWRLTLLRPDQVKRLRAMTSENLGFFRGVETRGGRLEDGGTVVVDGKSVHKLSFRYSEDIVFHRYFDLETGRLVLTETEQGSIREDGEMYVDGIRFPKRIITKNKLADGKEAVVTIEFESIMVNESIARSLFAVPPLK